MPKRVYDAVVVGSGAGGSALAWAMVKAGAYVAVLEKGSEAPPRSFEELDEASASSSFVPSVLDDPHVLERIGMKAERTTLGWIASCVGGGTTRMGASMYRLHPADFHLAELYGAFEEVADWPYSYDDLEPHYTEAERVLGVCGVEWPLEYCGHRSGPYPMGPVVESTMATPVRKACLSRGLHPLVTPRAINSRQYRGRESCIYCHSCAGYPCPVGARSGMNHSLLAEAAATGRCHILSRAMVTEVLLGSDGLAKGCAYIDSEGVRHRVDGRFVCIACSAVESARLLLLSTSSLFPQGLSNNSGHVGRHLQFLSSSSGRCCLKKPPSNNRIEWHSRFVGVSIADYYFIPGSVGGIPKGGMIKFDLNQQGPIAVLRRLAAEGKTTLWGERFAGVASKFFLENAELEYEIFHDFFPCRSTMVSLDPDIRDKWGLPAARITVAEPAAHKLIGAFIIDQLQPVIDKMAPDMSKVLAIGEINPHIVLGTCRAGRNPQTSVVNEYCQSHDVKNLFIVDGSFMPSTGGVPPTLTIVANSLRTADYIVRMARMMNSAQAV